jgi:hypothetical protein
VDDQAIALRPAPFDLPGDRCTRENLEAIVNRRAGVARQPAALQVLRALECDAAVDIAGIQARDVPDVRLIQPDELIGVESAIDGDLASNRGTCDGDLVNARFAVQCERLAVQSLGANHVAAEPAIYR